MDGCIVSTGRFDCLMNLGRKIVRLSCSEGAAGEGSKERYKLKFASRTQTNSNQEKNIPGTSNFKLQTSNNRIATQLPCNKYQIPNKKNKNPQTEVKRNRKRVAGVGVLVQLIPSQS